MQQLISYLKAAAMSPLKFLLSRLSSPDTAFPAVPLRTWFPEPHTILVTLLQIVNTLCKNVLLYVSSTETACVVCAKNAVLGSWNLPLFLSYEISTCLFLKVYWSNHRLAVFRPRFNGFYWGNMILLSHSTSYCLAHKNRVLWQLYQMMSREWNCITIAPMFCQHWA